MAKIIGLTGFAGSGKDSVALVLKDYGYQKFAMAAKLKAIVADLYGFPLELMESQEFKAAPHDNLGGNTPRAALQHLGTEGFREVYRDTWVDYAKLFFNSHPEAEFWVITDIRFENELRMLRELGGTLIGVDRPETNPKPVSWLRRIWHWHLRTWYGGLYNTVGNLHPSEAQVPFLLEQADLIVHNTGTLAELATQVQKSVVHFVPPTVPDGLG